VTAQRPVHHITPASGFLGDPNGLIWHAGNYHVFHQSNPRRVWFGAMEWGHLSSPDLVHWTRHPTALRPSPGADAGGCWSGCVVIDGGVPTAVYTGVESLGDDDRWTQTVCLARGDSTMTGWLKDQANPVLTGPPEGLETVGFRDPFVWREADGWSMILGTGIAGEGGKILLFRSSDLVEWQYVGPIHVGSQDEVEPLGTGRMWECPQLAPLGELHLLMFSVWDDRIEPTDQRPPPLQYPVVLLGTFDGRTFHPRSLQRLDHGPECYAPALMVDPNGRVLTWGWSWEALTQNGRERQGWAGCLTFPRLLTLQSDGRLGIDVAPEVAALRGVGAVVGAAELRTGSPTLAGPMSGEAVDIEARFQVHESSRIGLVVRASPDRQEKTGIFYDSLTRRLEVERDDSSLWPEAVGGICGGPLDLDPGEPLELRVLIDRSIVEVFANGRFALTARIYPTRDDSIGVEACAVRGAGTVERLAVWRLATTETGHT